MVLPAMDAFKQGDDPMEPVPLFSEYAGRLPTSAERRRAVARGRVERSRAFHAMAVALWSWISARTRRRSRVVVPPRGDIRIVVCTDC